MTVLFPETGGVLPSGTPPSNQRGKTVYENPNHPSTDEALSDVRHGQWHDDPKPLQ